MGGIEAATPPSFASEQACATRESARCEERRTKISDAERAEIFESLIAEVGPVAYGIAVTKLGDRTSAEDALQDAYLQAYRGLRSFRGDASLKTWFLKIVVNSCKRHRVLWRKWTRVTKELEHASLENVALTWEGIADPGLRDRLGEAVKKLSDRQRTAFVLRYVHGCGIREISEVLGCAEGTVKATIHKAVVKLRRELEDVT